MNESLKIGAAVAAAVISTLATAQSTSSSQMSANTTDSGISMHRGASAPGRGALMSAVVSGSPTSKSAVPQRIRAGWRRR